ncbi:MAG TPA: nuclear transport factor 2 family protein [Steroidobacteraceae bacterium]|jgi:ketosteroid isomerase-like protein|nr:nuclear transport factor 2 family protein [Steroidobacteraceae bacterium]
MALITATWAQQFAAEWIAAWNSHDLERILAHYRDDFEMRSPLIIERMGVPSGILKGKAAIRPYWQRGLAAQPPLHFELQDVLVGVDTVAIYYRSVTRNRMVAEILQFDDQRRVIGGAGLYASVPSG